MQATVMKMLEQRGLHSREDAQLIDSKTDP